VRPAPDARVRAARAGDRAGVLELCRGIDATNFMIEAWDVWAASGGDLLLVAEARGRIVGALRAGFVGAGVVFSQGLRVAADYRRRGVARELLAFQAGRLAAAGVSTAFGVTGLDNQPARALFAANGWREVASVARRTLRGWRGSSARFRVGAGGDAGAPAVGRDLFLSRPGLAHFRRIVLGRALDHLDELLPARRLLAGDGVAAIADEPGADAEWLGAVAGEGAAVADFVDGCCASQDEPPRPWILDAPADLELQAHLDRRGFDPAGAHDRYVVLESRIAPASLAAELR
jgi:N-acetylglutamate synthase-like GNAT family acetyltransferase